MIINNKQELKKIVAYEKNIYFGSNTKDYIKKKLVNDERYLFFRYLFFLRHEEYCICRLKKVVACFIE